MLLMETPQNSSPIMENRCSKCHSSTEVVTVVAIPARHRFLFHGRIGLRFSPLILIVAIKFHSPSLLCYFSRENVMMVSFVISNATPQAPSDVSLAQQAIPQRTCENYKFHSIKMQKA
ncbi:hypothetical protein PIB30_086499 [Stylosanthes scabra]|uniref:Uncharacterized protein n=1 Tax=Stylosanthes scabra TaxID=79078 RepID=A0ABU6UWW6_9FABA|nr:hypothetical protein [Stylosanthes scabra]